MNKLTPAMRLSLSLTMLILSVLFIAELVGLVPNRINDLTSTRATIAESLAVQLSAVASRGDRLLMEYTIAQFVERNDEILSAAVRSSSGRLVASKGSHDLHWQVDEAQDSTLTHMRVPLYMDEKLWGNVEVSFQSIWGAGIIGFLKNTSVGLFLFLGVSGTLLFYLFLRKALNELNPSKVIPERVRAAFDVLAEGVIILDDSERIVLANTAFADRVEIAPNDLVGKRPSGFEWLGFGKNSNDKLPWQLAMRNNESITNVSMQLVCPSGEIVKFMVNGTPILDTKGKVRGVLATFDDMSTIEEKNEELQQSLGDLQESRNQISQKNKELEFLAMRDPLTGCYNRRSFFEMFDRKIEEARATGGALSCLMVDIDHFKAINDRYGHSVGDEVIKKVAEILASDSRGEDIVSRYGGEEFCVLSPALKLDQAVEVGERLRRAIAASSSTSGTELIQVTVSIGVSTMTETTSCAMDLVNLADQALYVAKESGRNRVHCYDAGDATVVSREVEPASEDSETQTPNSNAIRLERSESDAEFGVLENRIRDLEAEVASTLDENWHDSLYDRLTGLPNRMLLIDRTEQAMKRAERDGRVLAVLSIEMDILQRVDDAFGHSTAEKLLKSLSDRLMEIFRGTDTVGLIAHTSESTLSRAGNNEFVILCSDVEEIQSVTLILRRIQKSLEQPLHFDNMEMLFSGSVGVSVFPHDASNVEELLEASASARGNARNNGKRLNIAYYSKEMNQVSKKELRMEYLLYKAIDANQFVLFYQPKTDVHTGEVKGVEALIRWNSPELGMVSPLEFIPIVERGGMMPQVTEWVIGEACRQLQQWQPLDLKNIRVAINASPVDLRDQNFAAKLLAQLGGYDIPTKSLEVEITETGVMENMKTAIKSLRELQENGVTLSLDDFGTGHSSLSHLNALPLNVLKIDGCFVRDIHINPSNEAIVRAIVAMANTAGLTILAEGVETAEELLVLRNLGVDEIQGFVVSRPLSAEDVTEFILTTNAEFEASRHNRKHGRVIDLLPRWLSARG